MTQYRDEREALRQRIANLEEQDAFRDAELAEAKAQLRALDATREGAAASTKRHRKLGGKVLLGCGVVVAAGIWVAASAWFSCGGQSNPCDTHLANTGLFGSYAAVVTAAHGEQRQRKGQTCSIELSFAGDGPDCANRCGATLRCEDDVLHEQKGMLNCHFHSKTGQFHMSRDPNSTRERRSTFEIDLDPTTRQGKAALFFAPDDGRVPYRLEFDVVPADPSR